MWAPDGRQIMHSRHGADLSGRSEVMAAENRFDLLAIKIKHDKTSP